MAKLKDLKVGQDVYVVHQRDRWAVKNNKEPKTEWLPVVKIGRKYGYIETYSGKLSPFCLHTGNSVHNSDCNARANGYGFDVYRSGYEYSEVLHLSDRRQLVEQKMREVSHLLRYASLEVCNGLLEWLDKWQQDSKKESTNG